MLYVEATCKFDSLGTELLLSVCLCKFLKAFQTFRQRLEGYNPIKGWCREKLT